MNATHTAVLQALLRHPKIIELNPDLVTEAYEIMARFAPSLAEVHAVAGHFVRVAIQRQDHVDLSLIKALCEAEIAARDAMSDDFIMGVARDAYFAGAAWVTGRDLIGHSESASDAFDHWWKNGDRRGE